MIYCAIPIVAAGASYAACYSEMNQIKNQTRELGKRLTELAQFRRQAGLFSEQTTEFFTFGINFFANLVNAASGFSYQEAVIGQAAYELWIDTKLQREYGYRRDFPNISISNSFLKVKCISIVAFIARCILEYKKIPVQLEVKVLSLVAMGAIPIVFAKWMNKKHQLLSNEKEKVRRFVDCNPTMVNGQLQLITVGNEVVMSPKQEFTQDQLKEIASCLFDSSRNPRKCIQGENITFASSLAS